MKEIFRIFLVVFLEVFFLSFPFWAKFITDNPLIFPPEDKPLDWLMFGATYYGVAASFLMIFYTSLSLKQNRKQLDEMKRNGKKTINQRLLHIWWDMKVFYIFVSKTYPLYPLKIYVLR